MKNTSLLKDLFTELPWAAIAAQEHKSLRRDDVCVFYTFAIHIYSTGETGIKVRVWTADLKSGIAKEFHCRTYRDLKEAHDYIESRTILFRRF